MVPLNPEGLLLQASLGQKPQSRHLKQSHKPTVCESCAKVRFAAPKHQTKTETVKAGAGTSSTAHCPALLFQCGNNGTTLLLILRPFQFQCRRHLADSNSFCCCSDRGWLSGKMRTGAVRPDSSLAMSSVTVLMSPAAGSDAMSTAGLKHALGARDCKL